jgi:hypothetical protein
MISLLAAALYGFTVGLMAGLLVTLYIEHERSIE